LQTGLISRHDLPVLNFFSPTPNPTLECTMYYLMKYLLQTIISFAIRELPLVASRGVKCNNETNLARCDLAMGPEIYGTYSCYKPLQICELHRS